MRHQEIILSLAGQSFTYDPPEGRPSGTPTVQVFSSQNDDDGGSTESATTGACSVDSVNTTLSVAAVRGDSSLTLTSGTGVAVRTRYLLSTAAGDREWVDVLNVSGAVVGLRRPLLNDYAITTSTFQGCRISIAVDSTWSSTKSKLTDVLSSTWKTDVEVRQDEWGAGFAGYRLRWAYTVNSVATIGVSFADLVRYQAKNLVTGADVDDKFPGWIDRLPIDHREDQGARFIEEAFAAIRMDALADAQVLRRVRDTQVLHDLVIHKANVLMLEGNALNGADNAPALKVARELYQGRYDQLLREPKMAIDPAGGGASGPARRLPAWRR